MYILYSLECSSSPYPSPPPSLSLSLSLSLSSARPTPLEYLQCPQPDGDTFGVCVQGCSSDSDCTTGMLCCSNGCDRTCQRGDSIPYYDIPATCPVSDGFGICVVDENSCFTDSDCDADEGELCCRSGCGQTCEQAITSTTPCLTIRDAIDSVGDPSTNSLGMFRPICLSDGSFSPVQCHGSSCWCVHTQTGLPLSRRTPIGTNLTCTSEYINSVC